MSKGLIARVNCQQRNARTSAILSVFPKPCFFAKILLCCWFHYFSVLSRFFKSESCQKKAVFVQRYSTSFHSKFRQTALKLTPKGLDYTQIDTLREPCITDHWFWEVLGQSWLRTMQTDLWKLYVNSRIFEFLTPCSKIKLLRMRKNVISVPLKDPRHEAFNCNTVPLPFVGFFNESINETTISWQLKTSSTIERRSHFKIIGWSQDGYTKKFLNLLVFKWKQVTD